MIKVMGVLLIILALLAIIPSLVSGVGLVFALVIMLLSALTTLSGHIRYALIVAIITTANILFFSISTLGLFSEPSNDYSKSLDTPPFIHALPAIEPPDIKIMAESVAKESGIPYDMLMKAQVVQAKPLSTFKRKRNRLKSKLDSLLGIIPSPL